MGQKFIITAKEKFQGRDGLFVKPGQEYLCSKEEFSPTVMKLVNAPKEVEEEWVNFANGPVDAKEVIFPQNLQRDEEVQTLKNRIKELEAEIEAMKTNEAEPEEGEADGDESEPQGEEII